MKRLGKLFLKMLVLMLPLAFGSSLIVPVTGSRYASQIPGNSAVIQNTQKLEDFKQNMKNENINEVRGVYAHEKLQLSVVKQPSGQVGYISSDHGTATLFSQAELFDAIGLLAHNYLSGDDFFNLVLGDEIQLIYGDGTHQEFIVKEIHRYEAVDPNNIRSKFIDLFTGEKLNAPELVTRMYGTEGNLTLQTCIEKDGNQEWGRLFVVAEPVSASV